MKIGIYSPYYGILGGGELYLGTIADALSGAHEVELVSESDIPIDSIRTRFSLSLNGVKCRTIPPVPFVEALVPGFFRLSSYRSATAFTGDYDLFFLMPRNFRIPFRVLSRRKILHLQVPDRPWTARDFAAALLRFRVPELRNQLVKRFWYPRRYSEFDAVLINSQFHADVISKRLKNSRAIVLPPPVRLKPGLDWDRKESLILSAGRFFRGLHSKRQDVLVDAFRKMHHRAPGWRLVMAGGLSDDQTGYMDELEQRALGLPVTFLPNAPLEELDHLYHAATIYWHAAGFETPPDHPERMEHFGITTVEAMSAGCIPIVCRAGGQLEIVQHGANGFTWSTVDELVATTLSVIDNRAGMSEISTAAVDSSHRFRRERFIARVQELVDQLVS